MDLSNLPVRDHFRLRGEAMTRLETFVDAAFAFAVTLLVVSFDAVLRLDAAERLIARSEIVVELVLVGCALLSIAVALLLPEKQGWEQALPGMVYSLLGIVLPWYETTVGRRIDALAAQRDGLPAK